MWSPSKSTIKSGCVQQTNTHTHTHTHTQTPTQLAQLLSQILVYISWQLSYPDSVELFDRRHGLLVCKARKGDGHALPAKAAAAPYSVQVRLLLQRHVVVDDQADLLHVDASRPHIGGNEHAVIAGAKGVHDGVPLLLLHVAVHGGDDKVALLHLLGEPLHFPARVAEDDGLRDGERLVEVAQRVKLPLLLLDVDVELANAVEAEAVALDQHGDGLRHELFGHFQHVGRQRGRHQHHLHGGRRVAINVVHLLLEAHGEHLVGLVDEQHGELFGVQHVSLHHVVHAARRAADNVHAAAAEAANVVAHLLAAHAGVRADGQKLAQQLHVALRLHGELARGAEHEHLHVRERGARELQRDDGYHGGLAGAALRLRHHVVAAQHGHDAALLDGGRQVEAHGVDAAQQGGLEVHVVKALEQLHVAVDVEGGLLGLALGEGGVGGGGRRGGVARGGASEPGHGGRFGWGGGWGWFCWGWFCWGGGSVGGWGDDEGDLGWCVCL
ncbi:eukaryotic translation initiation factor 4A [Gracilaria domingensis]|nr:eukaryotic translation initiation factor 4A [Gracilaria domingensis]